MDLLFLLVEVRAEVLDDLRLAVCADLKVVVEPLRGSLRSGIRGSRGLALGWDGGTRSETGPVSGGPNLWKSSRPEVPGDHPDGRTRWEGRTRRGTGWTRSGVVDRTGGPRFSPGRWVGERTGGLRTREG